MSPVMTRTHYIGIDGGGTKTEGVLTDAAGKVLGVQTLGASNPNDIGINNAAAVIAELIGLLTSSAQIPLASVSVFAGISGALAVKDDLQTAIQRLLPDLGCLTVHSDVINLLSAESPSGDGVCLICGTGSVCFARHGDDLKRVGGWGYLLDSAGSGYDIGRMALEAALKACDGRADASHEAILHAVTQYLGASPDQCIPLIYEKGKPYIASCAPLVFALAEQGDAVADRILNINAQALATCISTALCHVHTPVPVTVVMGGSICVKESPAWMQRIARYLKQTDRERVILQVADAPPVFGALAEAIATYPDRSRVNAYTALRQVFLSTYHN